MIKAKVIFILSIWSMYTEGDCLIEEGKFNYEIGGEYSYELHLKRDGKFIIQHDQWNPGQAQGARSYKYEGGWACDYNKVTLKYSMFTENGMYGNVGPNPIGLNPSSKSLRFTNSDGVLNNLILLEAEK